MKKIFRKAVCALMALVMTVPLAACGGGEGERKQPKYDPVSPDSIKIVVSNLGFGVEWAYDIAAAFMTTHPGKSVTVEPTVMSAALISQLEAGSNIGDIAMFNDDALWKKWRLGVMTQLDDVVSATPDGETQTIAEKMNHTLIEAYRQADDHFYSVPWINENGGFVYNKTSLNTLLGAGNWTLPKTTHEMLALCERIKTAGGYGFVWNSAYLGHEVFAAQYNGLETDEKYRDGLYWTGSEWKLSDNAQCVGQNTGYLRTLGFWEKVIKSYSHQYSQNMTHIYAQSAWSGIPYAGDSKLSVFMPNGDWTYNETKDYLDETQAEVGFMRAPVLSDMVETLELYREGSTPFAALSAEKQNEYDAVLRAVIDWVDGGETGAIPTYKGSAVSAADLARIRSARQLIGGKCQAEAFIPANSTKKELAKEFLIFMASDMAIDLFSKATYGLSPFIGPENYGNVQFDVPFMQDVLNELIAAPVKVVHRYNALRQAGYFLPKHYSFSGGLSIKSAQKFFEDEITRFQTDWSVILQNAGLASEV